jgi:hypothetical protein
LLRCSDFHIVMNNKSNRGDVWTVIEMSALTSRRLVLLMTILFVASLRGIGASAFAQADRELVKDLAPEELNKPKVTPEPISAPALEAERETFEASGKASQSIKVTTGMEGAAAAPVQKVSATHFVIDVGGEQSKNFFMCRIEGAAGQTIRLDIRRPRGGTRLWAALNPVYAYNVDLADPAAFAVGPPSQPAQPGKEERAHNGAILPETSAQSWHFAKDSWWDGHTFSMVQRFDQDQVVVAMRVPLTPSLTNRLLDGLSNAPDTQVITVGKSAEGRPLRIVKIGAGGAEAERTKPCVLIYAREHGNEQDAGWEAYGAIRFLTAATDAAKAFRQTYTFIVIALLNPDHAAAGVYSNKDFGYQKTAKTSDAVAYGNWFWKWIDSGNRLDIVFDLHNVESGEGSHLFCGFVENSVGRKDWCLSLHQTIRATASGSLYDIEERPRREGWMTTRLGGWLGYHSGPLFMLYECNSQTSRRHLSLGELQTLGAKLVQGSADFLAAPAGKDLLRQVDRLRQDRQAQVASAGDLSALDAIDATDRLEWNILPTLDALRASGEAK